MAIIKTYNPTEKEKALDALQHARTVLRECGSRLDSIPGYYDSPGCKLRRDSAIQAIEEVMNYIDPQ